MMTDSDKAEKYDYLISRADVVTRKLSRLKSQNAGINTQSDDYDRELKKLNDEYIWLESELNKLLGR